jgi:hypothetical protein
MLGSRRPAERIVMLSPRGAATSDHPCGTAMAKSPPDERSGINETAVIARAGGAAGAIARRASRSSSRRHRSQRVRVARQCTRRRCHRRVRATETSGSSSLALCDQSPGLASPLEPRTNCPCLCGAACRRRRLLRCLSPAPLSNLVRLWLPRSPETFRSRSQGFGRSSHDVQTPGCSRRARPGRHDHVGNAQHRRAR